MIVASDLDGVLCWNPENAVKYRPYRMHEWYRKCQATKHSKMPVDYVITGRKIHFKKVTFNWLESNGVRYKELVMFPNKVKRTNRSLAIYKAQKINELNVDLFLEDDERIAQFLRDHCSNTDIVLIDEVTNNLIMDIIFFDVIL